MENKIINNLRLTCVNMIEKAKSGHPGMALDFMPCIYTLYAHNLNVVPSEPNHILRDRIVFSAGHVSSAYYTVLNAMGFDVSINDLKSFRQYNSITPGHPEYGITPGVDTSTGPLGQGVANAVGMAIAERMMAARFNKNDIKLFDNYTYAIVGEGCLMEGISHEVLSLAGSLKLNKLIVIYDYNAMTIEGGVNDTFEQNTKTVMEGYGFNVIDVNDGNDINAINKAIEQAKLCTTKPNFIRVKTTIGFGSHMAGLAKVHGTPIGENGIEQLKKNLKIDGNAFELDGKCKEYLVNLRTRFDKVKNTLDGKLKQYKLKYKKDYEKLVKYFNEDYSDIDNVLKMVNQAKDSSMRDVGGLIINAVAEHYENIVGGAADVGPSTRAQILSSSHISAKDFSQRNIKYGVREFAMSTISNGIALYGGLRPFAATYFIFTDYMKSGMRMSALMGLPVIYILTHDSIAIGEDGPSHQAIEQLAGIREIPNFYLYRPCDINEAKACYSNILKNTKGPSGIALCRQSVKNLNSDMSGAIKGGYILKKEAKANIDGIFIATGSEVELAIKSAEALENKGYSIRVVSMPCAKLFDEQTDKYKEKVLPKDVVNRVAVELGSENSWYKYVGLNGDVMGLTTFGLSAPIPDLIKHFDFTSERAIKIMLNVIKNNKKNV